MNDTVVCPFCSREFYHENQSNLECPNCDRRFQKSSSGPPPWSRLAPVGFSLITLGVVAMLLNISLFLLGGLTPDSPPPPDMDPEIARSYEAGQATANLLRLGVVASSLVIYPVMIFGACRLLKGKNYFLATISCIIAAMPCSLTCLIGIPLGLWGLIMINKPDIKNSFR